MQRDILSMIIFFIATIILTRSLGIADYGRYLLIMIIPTTAEIIFRIKLDYSAIYFLSKKIITMPKIIFILNSYAVLASLSLLIIVYFLNLLNISLISSLNFTNSLLIVSIFFLRLIFINYSYLFIQIGNYKRYNMMILSNSLLYLISLSAAFYFFKSNIFYALISLIIGLIFTNLYAFFFFHKKFGIIFFTDHKIIFNFIKFSFKHYYTGLADFLFINLHQYIIFFLYSPSLLSIFNLSKMISDVSCRPFAASLSNILYPELTQKNNVKDTRIFLFLIKIVFILLFIIYFISFFLINDFINIIYGSDFKEISLYFKLIMPSSIALSICTIFYSYYSAEGKQIIYFKCLLISIISYLFIFLFFSSLGFSISIALSLLFSSYLLLFQLLIKYISINNINYLDLLMTKYEIKLIKRIVFRVFKKIYN